MTSNTLAEALRALAAGEKHRSETARLRDVFDEVENALNAGVSRVAVLDALHAQGFSLTLKSFESALYRIRQKRRLAQEAKIAAVASTCPPSSNTGGDQGYSSGEAQSRSLSDDDPDRQSKKQRREDLADKFITPTAKNQLLKGLKRKG